MGARARGGSSETKKTNGHTRIFAKNIDFLNRKGKYEIPRRAAKRTQRAIERKGEHTRVYQYLDSYCLRTYDALTGTSSLVVLRLSNQFAECICLGLRRGKLAIKNGDYKQRSLRVGGDGTKKCRESRTLQRFVRHGNKMILPVLLGDHAARRRLMTPVLLLFRSLPR